MRRPFGRHWTDIDAVIVGAAFLASFSGTLWLAGILLIFGVVAFIVGRFVEKHQAENEKENYPTRKITVPTFPYIGPPALIISFLRSW